MSQKIEGLKTDIPDGMEPNAKTVAALLLMERMGLAGLQVNESDPDDVEAIMQLAEISGERGLILALSADGKQYVLVNPDCLVDAASVEID